MAPVPKPVARHLASFAAASILLYAVSVTAVAGRLDNQVRTPTAPRSIGANEGVVQGRIVDARSGRPIPKATVELDGPRRVMTTSDEEGRYESGTLEPGDYRVSARASGYVPAQYGQRQVQDRGEVLAVRAGQLTSGVSVQLHPAATVRGRVFDDRGEGLAGVEIELLTERYTPDGPIPMAVGFAQSEDAGAFQFANVLPGDYFVRAYVGDNRRPSRGLESQVYRATFLPGVPDLLTAQALRIGAGDHLFGVDFALLATSTRRVSGTVTDRAGSGASLHVRLNGIGWNSTRRQHDTAVDADGHFEIRDVTPGDYMIMVAEPKPGADSSRWLTATRQITVEDDVVDLELQSRVGAHLEGRVIRDPDAIRRLNPSSVNVELLIPLGSRGWLGSRSGFVIAADGAFSLSSPGGESSIRVSGLPSGWTLKAVRLEGRDITNEMVDFGDGIRRGIEVVLTDRMSGVAGIVMDENGRPAAQSSIVVFADDRTKWTTPSRFVRETRSNREGRFEFGDLPPADYLVVALERVPPNAWTDPDVLDRLRSLAIRFELDEGEQQAISLRMSPTPRGLFPVY